MMLSRSPHFHGDRKAVEQIHKMSGGDNCCEGILGVKSIASNGAGGRIRVLIKFCIG